MTHEAVSRSYPLRIRKMRRQYHGTHQFGETHLQRHFRIHPQKSSSSPAACKLWLQRRGPISRCLQVVSPLGWTQVRAGSLPESTAASVPRASAACSSRKTSGGRPYTAAVEEKHVGNRRQGQDGQEKLREQGPSGRREGGARE
jgi:hypothetical protein